MTSPQRGPLQLACAYVVIFAVVLTVLTGVLVTSSSFQPMPERTDASAGHSERPLQPPSSQQARMLRCLHGRWIVLYGDSIVRGVFHDLRSLLEGAAPGALPREPHDWSYSDFCLEQRRRAARTKNYTACSMFDYVTCSDAPTVPMVAGDDVAISRGRGDPQPCEHQFQPKRTPCQDHGGGSQLTRLTYYGKEFAYDECLDSSILGILANCEPRPTDIVVGSALWDMLHTRSQAEYARRVQKLLSAVRKEPRLTGVRLHWLGATAVVSDLLPPERAAVMTSSNSQVYNEIVMNVSEQGGGLPGNGSYIDLFTPTAAHPEFCIDGVHYPGLGALPLATLDALC